MIGYGYDRFLRALYSRPQENAVVLSGIPPLHLVGSKGKPLKNYRIYGNTQRTITIDGVKYPVPDDVTLVEYVSSSGATAVDLGLVPVSTDDISIRRRHKDTSTAVSAYFGCMTSSSASIPRMGFGKYTNGCFAGFNATQVVGSIDTDWHTIRMYHSNSTNYVQFDGGTPQSYTPQSATECTLTAYLFARHGTSGVQVYDGEGTDIALVDWKNANGVQRMLATGAVKNNVVGVYDFVSKQFIAPTSGTLTAGKTTRTVTIGGESIEVPLCEYESVGDRTENLFDSSDMTLWENINADGSTSSSSMTNHSNYIAVMPNTAYVVKDHSNFASGANQITRYHAYGSDKAWLSQITSRTVSQTDTDIEVTFTTPANCYFVRFTTRQPLNNAVIMMVEGSTAPSSYIPYGYKVPVLMAGGGRVDMGTLAWSPIGNGCFYASVSDKEGGRNLYCSKYPTDQSGTASGVADKHIGGHGGNRVYFRNTSIANTRVAAQADLSGVNLYYQRTTDAGWVAPTITNLYVPSPLAKVTDADYIDLAKQIWHKCINVKVLTGEESMEYDSAASRICISLSAAEKSSSITVQGLCSHYHKAATGTAAYDQCFSFRGNGTILYIKDTAHITDAATAAAYLAAQYANGTPVIVWYVLATPVEQSITLPGISAIAGGCYIQLLTDINPYSALIKYIRNV